MQVSYTNNYIKIYLWQGISIVLNLLSFFIVISKLSTSPSVYGIFSLCTAASVFLAYADLGFLSACFKYASECFAKENRENEIKITAFSTFILIIFVSIVSLIFFLLSFRPEFLISGLKAGSEYKIASNLLLILSLSSFNTIFQRILTIVFGIRLKDYLYQRINILSSLLKISSVLYFFRLGVYDIVGYFLFIQSVSLISSFIGLWLAKEKFKYDFIFFIKQIKFSKSVYDKTKGLALNSITVTILFILYFELDSFAIAKFLGAASVAYFAVGFTIMTFLRSVFGTVFNPFSARFNHFIGMNDIEGLKKFFIQIVLITLPIVMLPVLILTILMEPLIVSWVGFNYQISISIGVFLVLTYIIGFIGYPASILLTALMKLKNIYIVNIFMVLVYWVGIIFTVKELGIESFAVFKLISYLISGSYMVYFSAKFLNLNTFQFIMKIIKPSFLPIFMSILLLLLFKNFIPISENKINLIYVIISGVITSGFFIFIYYFTCLSFQNYCKYLFGKLYKK